ncbi:aminotransferase class I/II-fold pyridoxal phosphate-dependent enzyme [Chitinophaga arvensicola]|uniref:7-keto-8-aminopelargonate synthetase n=1 Tax=Chitinophaga arvensicola TaxID=29529 RepID=A0A1I0RBS2_9BACT|nr:aminotransferase class I/II-fold pyridoxal phosphate-dependent enzyme [Chitinophaga arvensicola]SEW38296.1 7-keto-8-aminopelargonate synthetase [Chitinophaga arvensicola]
MLYTDHTPGRTVTLDGRSCLFFSGFAYLGLHHHPVFKATLTTGMEKYGLLFPSSRAANLRLSIYEEIEHALGKHLQQQAAAVFSSGYMAAQAAVQYALATRQPLYAPDAHPSLWYQQPVLPAISREEWITQTIEKVNTHPDDHFVIITDTVNPLTSTIHPFHWLQELQRKVLVVADDSHGIGILGPTGQGAIHFLPEAPTVRYLLTASLAKAYSLQGGVVAGHAADIMALKRSPLFSGSTPMMPAAAYAWLQSGELIQKMQRILQQNIAYLLHLTANTGVHNPHGLPMFILPSGTALVQYLQDRDLVISSFPYPLPHSEPINRAVVSALHLQEDVTTLHQFLREYGIK